MLAALLLLFQFDLGPTLQPGANAEFYGLCLAVEEKLEQGDFASAEKLALVLPRRDIAIRWDDSGVPAIRRPELKRAKDRALSGWLRAGIKLEFHEEKQADLTFSFVPTLPPNADSDVPAGAVHFFSQAATEPRLETVIALKRGGKQQPTEAIDVFNEVAYSVGAYLGIQRNPVPGSFSFRSEEPVYVEMSPGAGEFILARRNLEVADVLRKAVAEKRRLVPTRPQIRIEPATIQLEPVVQGESVKFSFLVSNIGNSPLLLRVRPDCSCVTGDGPGTIAPGGSGLIEGSVDTREAYGSLHKRMLVFSNDPDAPLKQVPVLIDVAARYRLIGLDGDVLILDKGKAKDTAVFLTLGPGTSFKPTNARIDGRPAKVSWSPWEGTIRDPELNEPEKPRHGYKFNISLPQQGPPGRNASTLVIHTDDPSYPELRYTFYTQVGIVALPDEVYFGEIQREPRRAAFTVDRHGSPFKIVKIESDNPRVTAEWDSKASDNHLVIVQLDGKMDYGSFNASLTIHTDDPSQPKVYATVRAVVR